MNFTENVKLAAIQYWVTVFVVVSLENFSKCMVKLQSWLWVLQLNLMKGWSSLLVSHSPLDLAFFGSSKVNFWKSKEKSKDSFKYMNLKKLHTPAMWLFLGFHSIKTTTTIAYPLWDATPEKVASLYFVNFPLWFKFRLSLFWGEYIALGYVEIFKVWKLADLLSSHKFLGHIPKDPKETWQFTLLYTFFGFCTIIENGTYLWTGCDIKFCCHISKQTDCTIVFHCKVAWCWWEWGRCGMHSRWW